MKIKILLTMLFVIALAFSASAQTVKITSKKTVYVRKDKSVPKEKSTFTVTYPVVSGALPAATKKNLEQTISYWRIFDTTLAENLGKYHWLTDLYYKVNYNKLGILDISLTQEGIGAYPDAQTVNMVVDLKTGKQVKFEDAFKADSRAKFAAMVDRKLEAEKKEIIESIRMDKDSYSSEEEQKSSGGMIEELKFTSESFDEFSVNDKGVTILYDAGFPHISQALEPNGSYFFTWVEVKTFIKPDGLLARFNR